MKRKDRGYKMKYCFDLDHTLCDTKQDPVTGKWDYMGAPPFEDRIAVVNRLYDEGHTIYIETARGSGSGVNWLAQTEKQLDGWGLKYHKLRTGVKFMADIFVDDRGVSDKDFFDNKR